MSQDYGEFAKTISSAYDTEKEMRERHTPDPYLGIVSSVRTEHLFPVKPQDLPSNFTNSNTGSPSPEEEGHLKRLDKILEEQSSGSLRNQKSAEDIAREDAYTAGEHLTKGGHLGESHSDSDHNFLKAREKEGFLDRVDVVRRKRIKEASKKILLMIHAKRGKKYNSKEFKVTSGRGEHRHYKNPQTLGQ